MTFGPGNPRTTASHANVRSWRAHLATGVASAALLAYGARPLRAQVVPPAPPCNQISGIAGSIVTCSGNLSGGVSLFNGGGPFEVLNVQSLTANIAPAAGVTGIEFSSNGSVTVNAPFSITTTDADGIFASSNAGTVTITSTADITTFGSGSTGIQGSAQDALLTITSSGRIVTSGNNAFGIAAGTVYGPVTVNSTGDITTSGTFSAGINVGSIGQPGTTEGAITINSSGTITTPGISAIGINASSVYGPITINSSDNIAVSGAASIGINAQTQGNVFITSSGNITAGPDSSVAILALSQSANVTITATGDIATARQTGIGIYARAAQTASVFASGNISTSGDNAPGIAASGYTGTGVVATGRITTTGADSAGISAYGAGAVQILSTGRITTTGDASDGISAVSINGAVQILSTGDVTATGVDSSAIRAFGYTGNLVTNTGTLVGGLCACSGVGVYMVSNGDNTLINSGSISALSGMAIYAAAMGGTNTVQNFGTITGDVVLLGPSVFNNHPGALFNSGAFVQAGLVTNEGTIAPGGQGVIEQTLLGDQFVQTRTGTFAVDINGPTSDQIVVADTAQLAGVVAVNVTSLPPIAAGPYIILTAANGVTDNGLGLLASPALHATLLFPDPNTVELGIAVDFNATGLNRNEAALGGHLNAAFLAGSGGLTPLLLGLLNTVGLNDYKAALDQLLPEIYQDGQIAALYANLAFANALLSCRVNGPDTASVVREGQCLWAGATARFLDSASTFQQIGFSESAGLFAAGAQVALDDVWRLGFAAGYQTSSVHTATGASSEGEQAHVGAALKYNSGPLLLAGALTAGRAWNDTKRPMAFGGFTGVAKGDQLIDVFSGTMRAAYVFGTPSLYLKPMIDAGATRILPDDLQESGGNGAALIVQGSAQTVFTVTPALEVGTEWWLSNGTLVRTFVRGGVTWYGGADLSLAASFAAAPDGVAPFSVLTLMDDVMGVFGAGLDIIDKQDSTLRITYDGQFGQTKQIHGVGIKGGVKF